MEGMRVLFWLRKSCMNKAGQVPINVRVTLRGKVLFNKGVCIQVKVDEFDLITHRVKPTNLNHEVINKRLDEVEKKIFEVFYSKTKPTMLVEKIRAVVTRNREQELTARKIFFITEYPALIGFLHSFIVRQEAYKKPTTVLKYVSMVRSIETYIKFQYKKESIEIEEVDIAFCDNLVYYLKTKKKLKNQSIIKYFQFLKQAFEWAIINKLMDVNYAAAIHLKKEITPEIKFLSELELDNLAKYRFEDKRLERIRNYFLFCAYTGLAFSDLMALRKEHIKPDDNGNYWIIKPREKNGSVSTIPLLKESAEILSKYYNSELTPGQPIFTNITNQKMNLYLKEVGERLNLSVELTSHVARKTFATTILNSGQVSLDVVSKMLGHQSTTVTQKYYTRMNQNTIAEQMKGFSFERNYQNKSIPVLIGQGM